ncbi:MAG: aspartate ammonia-lyase [Gammaproteobacteria bacterium]
MKTRIESDSLGSLEIPADKYYGVQTQRAIDNFHVTGVTMSDRPKVVHALAAVKEAAACANRDLGLLDKDIAEAIIKASREIYDGALFDQFPVDMIQGGAGTSANMAANEVICNRALEIMGHKKGEYQYIHPNNHLNLSQSTNDVYPTAAKIAIARCQSDIVSALEALRDSFFAKAEEFKDIIKMGRTQLQDAVPMTLGQEFRAFGVAIDEDIHHLQDSFKLCHVINMGATAIGTGINTLPGYADLVCKYLSKITNLPVHNAMDLVEATSDTAAFVSISSVLKRFAVKLTKICNDLRLLSSGPKAGLGDINLPARQPGSSIMPGKVNPVIPEVVNQICFQVIGFDLVVTMAASAGQLQLNAFEPVMLYDILESIILLKRGCLILKEKCVDGITANVEHCNMDVRLSAGLLTAFTPYIGYEAAAKIAKEVMKDQDKTVYDLIRKSGLLTDEEVDMILLPMNMTKPLDYLTIADKIEKDKGKR